MVNRITYVSADGDVFTINPDGGSLLNLTGGVQALAGSSGAILAQPLSRDSYYTWPTWSPDGAKLAVSRVRLSGERPQISVQVIDTGTGRSSTFFENTVPGMIGQGAPHYLYWAPDGRSLAILATTPDGLALVVGDTHGGTAAQVVQTGAPLYFQWSSDAQSIVVHVGEEMKLLKSPLGTEARVLVTDAVGFRAPALAHDGIHLAYTRETAGGAALFIGTTDGSSPERRLLDLGPISAFLWSPDGKELAVADQQGAGTPVFQRLRVVSSDGDAVRTITEEAIVAFFWSPSGENIAWVGLKPEERMFELAVASRAGPPALRLFRFQPSGDSFTLLSFFDQYAYSHSPWSPDGTQLVVAGTPGPTGSRRNGQTPTGDRVYVVDATGAIPPKEIAAGTLAFWSWN
jgi:Tol biopolymer transport system component